MTFLRTTALLVCLAFVGFTYGQDVDIRVLTFDNDLETLIPHSGGWRWSDRASMDWRVPDGNDGFAVYERTGEGDELYEQVVDISVGLTYEIRFFFASKYSQGTTFQVQLLRLDGSLINVVEDYTSLSSPFNTEWITVSGEVPPIAEPSRVCHLPTVFQIGDLSIEIIFKYPC